MSELAHYYREVACNSSTWAHPEKAKCQCGGGWWLSEVDTWHACPYHNDPEDGHPED
jgi:hypothetical protein